MRHWRKKAAGSEEGGNGEGGSAAGGGGEGGGGAVGSSSIGEGLYVALLLCMYCYVCGLDFQLSHQSWAPVHVVPALGKRQTWRH